MNLRVKRLTDTARIPTRNTSTDAAFDVYSDEDVLISAGETIGVSTGIALAPPQAPFEGFSTYIRVAPRSGLAVKNGLDTFAGVIDAGYRGELKVALFNSKQDDYQVKKGDRIAQLIVTVIMTPEVEEVEELDDTERGKGGFGSSGR